LTDEAATHYISLIKSCVHLSLLGGVWSSIDEAATHYISLIKSCVHLSLLGGGWSSTDEAATHYISLIDNMEFGLNWLKDNVGETKLCFSS
jgi:hypothetical protein